MASEDPFDDVLNLEEQIYRRGYDEGFRDGISAGRIEGRGVGVSKGFEKFVESGRLASKAIVWANRMPPKTAGGNASEQCTLPTLPRNARLEKNINTLYALVEPDTLSTSNTDEAVQDFDDRVKRAQGKAKVIERMVAGNGAKETPESA